MTWKGTITIKIEKTYEFGPEDEMTKELAIIWADNWFQDHIKEGQGSITTKVRDA